MRPSSTVFRALRGPGESYSDVILRLAGNGEPREGQNRR
jgi:hypothetical protein